MKVLDFGLAKPLEGEQAQGDQANSPTLTAAASQMGVIIGTAAYMSPEQARGKTVDRRADIWALGTVLYEMLTGTKPFPGDDVSQTLARVIDRDPDWTNLPPLPSAVDAYLRRCLQKDVRQRVQAAGDVRLAFDGAFDASGAATAEAGETLAPPALWQRPVVIAAMVLGAVAVTAFAVWSLTRPVPLSRPVTRFAITLPPSDSLTAVGSGPVGVALSPDGGQLVYAAMRGQEQLLFLRARDQLEAVPLRGTDGAMFPFFSPSGEWVGFFDGAALKKVSLAGGTPVTLCEAEFRFGASWGDDDTIVFATRSQPGLMTVSGAGGEPRPLTTPEEGELHRWPTVLPGSEAVIYTATPGSNVPRAGRVTLLELASGDTHELTVGTGPRYLPTGHLVFAREATLWAVPFDLDRLEVTGEPAPVQEGVTVVGGGLTHYDVADDGTLVYRPVAGTARAEYELVSVDRAGQVAVMSEERQAFGEVRVSPDGSRVAVEVTGGAGTEIWLFDPTRGTLMRFTVGGASNLVWSPDSSRIAYRGSDGMYVKAADGSDEAERLTTSDVPQSPRSWSPGGVLAFVQGTSDGDIRVLSPDGELADFISSSFDEQMPMFSPDGRWLAYVSDESGVDEVYLQPYPGPGGREQVSTQGGREPLWSPDGRELFYRDDREDLMVVSVTTEPTLTVGQPNVVLENEAGHYRTSSGPSRYYDMLPDGDRFVAVRSPADAPGAAAPNSFHVVEGWFEELKARVPTSQ